MTSRDVKTVILTRDATGNASWSARLEALGFNVYSLPTIETVPLELTGPQKATIQQLPNYDWLVFTSAKSVQYFIGALLQLGIKWQPETPLVAAIGDQTAHLIEKHGIPVAFKPTQADSMTLGNELTPIKGKRILLPQTDIASNGLTAWLAQQGAEVTKLPIYTTRLIHVPDEALPQKITESAVDFLVFASPSSVQGFSLRVADSALLQRAKSIPTIAIGPSTASALREAGFNHIQASSTPTISGIIEVLQQLINQ